MNDRRNSRAPFYFVLLTALVDFILAAVQIEVGQGPRTMLLTTSILGLSLGQMSLCLILLMRDVSAWKPLIGASFVSLLFGLSVTVMPHGANFDRVLVILLATLFLGIAPVAIYRVVFVGLQLRFSLSLLFGLMTVVTIICAVAIQMDFDWEWFLTYFFFFLGSAIPIPLAGFMLVGPRTAPITWFVIIMLSLSLICAAIVGIYQDSIRDIGLVIQIFGFMSLYLLLGGFLLLRELKQRRMNRQAELPLPEEDPLATD